MAKFDAATAVEEMDYDFTKYGGREGVVPEPSTGQVNKYFAGMRVLLREAQAASAKAKALNGVNLEEMGDDELAEAFENVDSAVAEASDFQAKTMELLAALCSDQPSVEELSVLPVRVLQAFNKWVIRQINPKSEGEAEVVQIRTPQDRRPATKGSRKARG